MPDETEPDALSRPEISRLFANLRPPYQLIAEWALATGLRRMEILALKHYQIPESFDLHESHFPFNTLDVTTVPIRLMQTPTTCRMLRRERGYAGVADRHRRLEWLWQLGDTRP